MATHDPDTQSRILDAAHVVFQRRGTAGARMQEIADEAGVNKALLHYYFRSKEKLAEAVFERAARSLFPPIMAILSGEAPLEEKVTKVVEHYLTSLSASPYLPAYVLSELHHHPGRVEKLVANATGIPVGGFAKPGLAVLERQIEEGVRAGTMRDIDPEQFATNLISLCLFPFAARPLIGFAFGWDQEDFDHFIEIRKRALPEFILGALRP